MAIKIKSIMIFKIILKLHDMEKQGLKPNISEFLRYTKFRPETFYKHKAVLITLKLIEEEKTSQFPFHTHLKLTEKGRRIAKALKEIEETLF